MGALDVHTVHDTVPFHHCNGLDVGPELTWKRNGPLHRVGVRERGRITARIRSRDVQMRSCV